MTAVVIDGKKKALEIRENLAREIAEAKARPVLAGGEGGGKPGRAGGGLALLQI